MVGRPWVVICAFTFAMATAEGQHASTYMPPRTPDGQPDLQGVWDMATLTPLERPAQFAGKAFLTLQEAADYERRTLEQLNSDRRDGGSDADLRRNYNEFWRDRGHTVVGSRRTSLIVDPPDGKLPPFTAAMRLKRTAQAEASRLPAGPEASDPAER